MATNRHIVADFARLCRSVPLPPPARGRYACAVYDEWPEDAPAAYSCTMQNHGFVITTTPVGVCR